MKKLLLILATFISTVAFSQTNYQDVVYLKNGSIIHGIIVEQIPNTSVKIQTADNNVFVFKMDEIEKLTKEETQGKSKIKIKNKTNESKKKSGYCGIVETGYAFGLGDDGSNSISLDIINGYRFNPYFSLGAGVGVHYYLTEKAYLIPLFADCRVNFINNTLSPYLSLGLGGSLNADGNFDIAGIFFNPTAGIKYRMPGITLLFGIGYEFQGVKFHDPFDNTIISVNTNVDAIKIKFGINF
ncbi:MAG: porin family protein [Prevotellaceae bacterium]|jgi:hypothetical protein|nr:porin family protein [Prevotellaceae bacterium]